MFVDKLINFYNKYNKFFYVFTGTLLIAAIIYFVYNAYINSVDVPYYDEWEAFENGHLSKNFNLKWILSFHNEHKVVWTRLITWFSYLLCDWNIRYTILFNAILYVATIGVLYKIIPNKNPFLPLAFLPLFSDIMPFNFVVQFQSSFHFTLLFAFLAIYFGFIKEDNYKNTILFSLFTVCSMYSMTLISAFALLFVFGIKEKFSTKRFLLSLIIVGAGIFYFLFGYMVAGYNQQLPFTYPWQLKFWLAGLTSVNLILFNSSILQFGFVPPNLIIFILVFAFIYLVIKGYIFRRNEKEYFVYLALFMLSAFLTIAVLAGRGILSVRHYEVIIYLIPCIFTFLIWNKKQLVACLFLAYILYSFAYSFSFYEYNTLKYNRTMSQYLLKKHQNDVPLIIPNLHPTDISDELKRAKELHVSFTKDLK